MLFRKLMPDTLRGMLNELLGGAEGKSFGFPVIHDEPHSAADEPATKTESELVEK